MRSPARGASLPVSRVIALRKATARGKAWVVMVVARRTSGRRRWSRQPDGGIARQHPDYRIRFCPVGHPGDDRNVLECLAGALAEVRRYGVGGLTGRRGPAAAEGRQRCDQLGDVVAEHVLRPSGRVLPPGP
jgi:hypothetical protein